MSWLKGKAAKSPPMPQHVPLELLMGTVAHLETQGMSTPALQYIRAKGPKQDSDKWGEPLPLSAVDQDRLDRMFAILAAPLTRGRALILAGMLAPDEVDALVTACPEAWLQLAQQAYREMHVIHPPYPAWVEATLGVLFQMPAAVAFTAEAPQQPNPQSPAKESGSTGDPSQMPTQADRRDGAVREQRS